MKRFFVWIFLVLTIIAPAYIGAYEVKDALGRSLSFQSPPERIVIAGRANIIVADTLYLFSDSLDRLIGMEIGMMGKGSFVESIDPDYRDRILLPDNVGVEEILTARPDLVILKSFMKTKIGDPLERLGVPVFYLDLETPEQYYRDLSSLGILLAEEKRSAEIIRYYTLQVENIIEKTSSLKKEDKPSALLLYYSEQGGERSLNMPPSGWMQTILVEYAGGRPVWTDARLGKGWTKVGIEQIAAWNPEYIFIVSYFTDVDEAVSRLKGDTLWASLEAVREERLFAFPTDFYSWDLPDPRWVLGLNWLASKLHPGLFGALDIENKAIEFFEILYSLSKSDYITYIKPVLSGDLD